MIEVIKGIIDIMIQFINSIFNWQIDFVNGVYVPIGMIVISFVFIVLAIYLILKTLGIKKGDD